MDIISFYLISLLSFIVFNSELHGFLFGILYLPFSSIAICNKFSFSGEVL